MKQVRGPLQTIACPACIPPASSYAMKMYRALFGTRLAKTASCCRLLTGLLGAGRLPAGGVLSGVQVLAATAATGVLQAVVGGQPLMIVGVAEPIVLMYKWVWPHPT